MLAIPTTGKKVEKERGIRIKVITELGTFTSDPLIEDGELLTLDNTEVVESVGRLIELAVQGNAKHLDIIVEGGNVYFPKEVLSKSIIQLIK